MAPSCGMIRERLLEVRGTVPAVHPEVLEHLDACRECSSFAQRAASIARGLSKLPRRSAPNRLDGLVVAATQAGFREDRAASSLRLLSRRSPPSELDARPLGNPAPRVLDRLVDEELRKLGSEAARRYASKVDRRGVAASQGAPLADPARGAGNRRRTRLGIAIASGLSAVALAAIWRFASLDPGVGPRVGTGKEPEPRFVVVYQSSLDSMDPMARTFLAGFTSGILDAAKVKEGR